MITLLIILGLYILNTILNRYLYIQLQKMDRNWYPNLPLLVLLFCSLLGTFFLLLLLILEKINSINFNKLDSVINKWFKYTPILLLFFLGSCTCIHFSDPIIIKEIELNINNSNHSEKYKYTLSNESIDDHLYYFSNIKYEIGDTLKIQ